MQSRAPGVTGTAIDSDAWCSIIADGIHVDPVMLGLAIRARPRDRRMIAVSDAMATVGGPDHFNLYGQDIYLKDGCLVNDEGALAGAHLTMIDALRNLVRYGVPLESALQMCGPNAFEMMGMAAQASIVGRSMSEVLLLDADLTLHQP
jgi:N-acetylglucosamine-6-phosphate deacetylase